MAGQGRGEAVWQPAPVSAGEASRRSAVSMRILYSHYLADDNHPAARMVQAIARELGGLGHEVRIHRCAGPHRPEPSGAVLGPEGQRIARNPIVATLKKRLWFARTLASNRSLRPRDRAAIAEFRPDVILAREDAYMTSMVHEAARAGVPLVTYADAPVAYEMRTFHSTARWHPPGLVERVERGWLRHSRAVITPTNPGRAELERHSVHVPIHSIPNGVDPDRFPRLDPERKRAGKAALGIPPDALVLGYQGTFRTFHGIDLLCDLIQSTAGWTGTHWLLVGEGPERPKLMSAVAKNPAVTLLGRQPPDRMGELVGLMDIGISTHVFVQGSFYLCPLKILEYAAAGCAVVASAQGDIPLLLDSGRVGVLLDRPEPDAWVAAVRQLVGDPDRVAQLGLAAHRWVLDHMTWRNTAERVAAVLESALRLPDQEQRVPVASDS